MIVVEHNLGFLLELVDRVVCMAQGSVIADGTPAEIHEDPRAATGDHGLESFVDLLETGIVEAGREAGVIWRKAFGRLTYDAGGTWVDIDPSRPLAVGQPDAQPRPDGTTQFAGSEGVWYDSGHVAFVHH